MILLKVTSADEIGFFRDIFFLFWYDRNMWKQQRKKKVNHFLIGAKDYPILGELS